MEGFFLVLLLFFVDSELVGDGGNATFLSGVAVLVVVFVGVCWRLRSLAGDSLRTSDLLRLSLKMRYLSRFLRRRSSDRGEAAA